MRPDPYDPQAFRLAGHAVVDMLGDYLEATQRADGPVLDRRPPADLLDAWPGEFTAGPGASLVDLLPDVLRQSHHLHHPRYIGHQVSAPLGTAALAELVGALLNNGMAEYEMGPVANAMEARLLDWLGGLLGFPAPVEGAFTSGGSIGNLTALAAARQAVDGLDVWGRGVAGVEPLAILVSEQAHYSNDRAARVLGLGAGGVVPVRCDDRYRLDPAGLREAHLAAERAGRRVFAIVANACSTATGAYDPLDRIADYAEAHDLWLHVDGAHGAAASLSPTYRGLLQGIERADSVVLDAHKMLLMPALVTAVLFRRHGAADRTFHQEQSYIGFHADADAYAWWDSGLRTLECTKRMMSLELYAALSEHGTEVFADYITRSYDLARWFAAEVSRAPDLELAVEPEANIVCFRYVPDRPPTDDLDALQVAIRDALVASGSFYLVKTSLRGRTFLRTTIINARTGETELHQLIEAIRETGAAIASTRRHASGADADAMA